MRPLLMLILMLLLVLMLIDATFIINTWRNGSSFLGQPFPTALFCGCFHSSLLLLLLPLLLLLSSVFPGYLGYKLLATAGIYVDHRVIQSTCIIPLSQYYECTIDIQFSIDSTFWCHQRDYHTISFYNSSFSFATCNFSCTKITPKEHVYLYNLTIRLQTHTRKLRTIRSSFKDTHVVFLVSIVLYQTILLHNLQNIPINS